VLGLGFQTQGPHHVI